MTFTSRPSLWASSRPGLRGDHWVTESFLLIDDRRASESVTVRVTP